MFIVLYIVMYIVTIQYEKQRNRKKTPEALIFRGFPVEVAGFEPAAFWSRTIRQFFIFNSFRAFVHYMFIVSNKKIPRVLPRGLSLRCLVLYGSFPTVERTLLE